MMIQDNSYPQFLEAIVDFCPSDFVLTPPASERLESFKTFCDALRDDTPHHGVKAYIAKLPGLVLSLADSLAPDSQEAIDLYNLQEAINRLLGEHEKVCLSLLAQRSKPLGFKK